ncbi:DUF1257 domain-containing protein [Lacunimicrobium album]
MSHIVTITTQIRDELAVHAACQRLQIAAPEQGSYELFNSRASGFAVRLRDWRYPVVCDLQNGKLHYDNYEGRWGDQRYLDQFVQAYAVEMTLLQARRQGFSAFEQPLEDGSVRIQIQTS